MSDSEKINGSRIARIILVNLVMIAGFVGVAIAVLYFLVTYCPQVSSVRVEWEDCTQRVASRLAVCE